MSNQDKLEKQMDTSGRLQRKVEEFSDILDDLVATEDKKKLLWKEIYENALTDRENAGMLFTDAWSRMGTGSTEHATLGTTLTKYLERMSKSNEQILRLAELISKAEEQSQKIEPDDIFSSIGGD
jgi:hypothetical protein